MKIYYGIIDNLIDITNICFTKLIDNGIITIPAGDFNRASRFGDHIVGTLKSIFIDTIEDNNKMEYNQYCIIKININDNSISSIETNDIEFKNVIEIKKNIFEKINEIHSKLKINYGNFNEEFPEQMMTIKYLKGHEKVLEIGGNIGRNSLVIASILYDDTNLVSLESDKNIAKQLTENRDINNLNFHIEDSALSNRKLIQKGWDTKPSDILEDGYIWVKTITLEELKRKYNIEFDTLILDCEGAFYYILMDMPEILNNINLIIMENDYYNIECKNYIDKILLDNNFCLVYNEAGGWGPCKQNFFQVWEKV
jgi:FkbM family methyltransferase